MLYIIIDGMKAINKLRKRRAVSPVIATVILVAVTITVAVAVAYWMSGIAGQYTQFERCEVQTAIVTLDSYGNWVVTVKLKNSGSKSATLTNIFVNDEEVTAYGASAPTEAITTITTNMNTDSPFSIGSGEDKSIIVYVGADYGTLSSGTTINIKIHSAGGMDYIKLVQLT